MMMKVMMIGGRVLWADETYATAAAAVMGEATAWILMRAARR